MELEELWSSVIPQCNQSFCTLTPLSDQSTSKELLYDSLREQQQKTEPFSLILRVGMDSALCGRLAHLSTLIDYFCTERKVVPVCQTTKTEAQVRTTLTIIGGKRWNISKITAPQLYNSFGDGWWPVLWMSKSTREDKPEP